MTRPCTGLNLFGSGSSPAANEEPTTLPEFQATRPDLFIRASGGKEFPVFGSGDCSDWALMSVNRVEEAALENIEHLQS